MTSQARCRAETARVNARRAAEPFAARVRGSRGNQRPASTGQKIADHGVEQIGLLQVHDVAGLRKHDQAGGGKRVFEEQARLDAALVLVADHDQRRGREFADAVFEIVERRPRALKAARGIGRSLARRARRAAR